VEARACDFAAESFSDDLSQFKGAIIRATIQYTKDNSPPASILYSPSIADAPLSR
jgi:hypothetical protein